MSAENNSALKWPNSHPPITLIIIDVGVGYWRRTSSTYNMLEGKSLRNVFRYTQEIGFIDKTNEANVG